MHIQERK